jgi:hypothetical protein
MLKTSNITPLDLSLLPPGTFQVPGDARAFRSVLAWWELVAFSKDKKTNDSHVYRIISEGRMPGTVLLKRLAASNSMRFVVSRDGIRGEWVFIPDGWSGGQPVPSGDYQQPGDDLTYRPLEDWASWIEFDFERGQDKAKRDRARDGWMPRDLDTLKGWCVRHRVRFIFESWGVRVEMVLEPGEDPQKRLSYLHKGTLAERRAKQAERISWLEKKYNVSYAAPASSSPASASSPSSPSSPLDTSE